MLFLILYKQKNNLLSAFCDYFF